MIGCELDTSVQMLDAIVKLAQIDIAQSQVAQEVGVLRVVSQQLLQIDAGLVEAAILDKLEGLG